MRHIICIRLKKVTEPFSVGVCIIDGNCVRTAAADSCDFLPVQVAAVEDVFQSPGFLCTGFADPTPNAQGDGFRQEGLKRGSGAGAQGDRSGIRG